MKIIEPSFQLSTPYSNNLTREDGIKMLRFIEQQGRISHRSEDRQTLDSWERFIPAVVLGHADWSITEHCSVTATIRTDRGISHELVRHRIGSYTQESTRFVRNAGELEFIRPSHIEDSTEAFFLWRSAVLNAEQTYHDLLKAGARPQEARSVIPNSLATSISCTFNLRNWRHVFLMRTSKETHPDFKRFLIPMLKQFQQVIPLLFDDFEDEREQRQIDNQRKPR